MSRGPRNPADLQKHGACKECGISLWGYENMKRELCGACMATLYINGSSLRDISKLANISVTFVRKMLANAGVKIRTRSEGMRAKHVKRLEA